jgi:hypothetical protein
LAALLRRQGRGRRNVGKWAIGDRGGEDAKLAEMTLEARPLARQLALKNGGVLPKRTNIGKTSLRVFDLAVDAADILLVAVEANGFLDRLLDDPDRGVAPVELAAFDQFGEVYALKGRAGQQIRLKRSGSVRGAVSGHRTRVKPDQRPANRTTGLEGETAPDASPEKPACRGIGYVQRMGGRVTKCPHIIKIHSSEKGSARPASCPRRASARPDGGADPWAVRRPSVMADTMALVEKHRLGSDPDRTDAIDSDHQQLLRAVASDQKALDDADVQHVLGQIYQKGWWVGCDCRSDARPLMTIRQHASGTYGLVRLPRRAAHAEDCPFGSEGSEADPSVHRGDPVDDSGVCFHRRSQDATETRQDRDTGPSSMGLRARLSTLERSLYTLLQNSGLTQTAGEEVDAKGQVYKIAEAAEEIPFAWQFTLRDYLYTKPWAIQQAALEIKEEWEQWPDGARPHGVFLFRGEGADGQTVRYRTAEGPGTVEVNDHLEMRSPEAGGPFAFLITVAGTSDNPRWLEPRKGIGVPLADKGRFFPVESGAERTIACHLIDCIGRWNEETETAITLEKPLFTRPTREGDVRPDLSVRWKEEEIPIRVIDTDVQTYISERQEDSRRLQALGTPVMVEGPIESGRTRGDRNASSSGNGGDEGKREPEDSPSPVADAELKALARRVEQKVRARLKDINSTDKAGGPPRDSSSSDTKGEEAGAGPGESARARDRSPGGNSLGGNSPDGESPDDESPDREYRDGTPPDEDGSEAEANRTEPAPSM